MVAHFWLLRCNSYLQAFLLSLALTCLKIQCDASIRQVVAHFRNTDDITDAIKGLHFNNHPIFSHIMIVLFLDGPLELTTSPTGTGFVNLASSRVKLLYL